MTATLVRLKRDHLPLIGLLGVQMLAGIMLTPLNNFRGIYLNEVLAYPLAQVAQVIALGQIVAMFASILSGSLSDRWGHKWILFVGIGAMAISSVMFFTHAPWLVIVLWCISSAGLGLSAVSGQGYLTLVSSAGMLGLASALYNWGYTIGGAIGTPLATVILNDNNYAAMGAALLGIGLVTVLIASLLPHIQLSAPSQPVRTIAGGYGVLRQRRIALLGLLRFLPTCYYGVTTLFPLLIKQQTGSNAAVAWYVTGSMIFASLAQLVAGRAADRYGVRLPTQIAFATILAAVVGTIFTAGSIWGLYIFGTLGVSAAWALSTLLPGLVTRAAEPEIRGRVFGALQLLWTIAMALGALIGGNLLDVDLRLPFMIVGVLNVIALGLTRPFFRMTAPQPAG